MGNRGRNKPRPKATTPDAAPRDANVQALLERFPKQSPAQLGAHVGVIVAVAALGLWGIFAARWNVTALLVFFAIEFVTIWALNWLAIALLPTHLEDNDRGVIKGWLWFAGVVAVGLVAYGVIEGAAGMIALRDWLFDGARGVREYLAQRRMLIPAAALVLIHLAGLLTDIAYWRQRGGAFRYWSATVFVMRLWFVIAAGIVLFVAAALTELDWKGRTAVVLLWALLLAADLFALWLPVAVRRKAEGKR